MEYGKSYFESLSVDSDGMDSAILDLCDSPSASAREFGLELFTCHRRDHCSPDLLESLAETEDAQVRRCVLELLGETASESETLAQLQRRVLFSPKERRATKDLARDQLVGRSHIDHDILLQLARSPHRADADWAVERLTELALDGETVKGFVVIDEGEI